MNLTTVSTLGLLGTVTLLLGTLLTGMNPLGQTVHAQPCIPGPANPDCLPFIVPNPQACLLNPFAPDCPPIGPPPNLGGENGEDLGSDIKNKVADRFNTIAGQINHKVDQINQRLASISVIPH